MSTPTTPTVDLEALLTDIVQQHLRLDNLETTNPNFDQYKEVSVWGLERALVAAFRAGVDAGRAGATLKPL